MRCGAWVASRRDVVAEAIGQVGQHVAGVPGQVHLYISFAVLGVTLRALSVVEIDSRLLAPVLGGEAILGIVDVVGVGIGAENGKLVLHGSFFY